MKRLAGLPAVVSETYYMLGNLGEDRTISIELAGSLDISRRDEIAALLPAPQNVDRVVVDCTHADFIDSTIISIFMRYRRAFVEAGGDPLQIIIVAQPSLRRIFEVAGLSSLVTVVTAPPKANRTEEPPRSIDVREGNASTLEPT